MAIEIIFDVATGKFDPIDTSGAEAWGADISACIRRHGRDIDLSGVQLGVTVVADGDLVLSVALPERGQQLQSTDQDVVATKRAKWPSGATVAIEPWVVMTRRVKGEAVKFVAPQPDDEEMLDSGPEG